MQNVLSSRLACVGKPAVRLLLILAVVAGGGLLARWWAPASSTQLSWYLGVEKPVWSLPAWALVPAGIAIHCLLGLAACLQERARTPVALRVLSGIALALGIVWSCLFYELRILWASSIVMISLACLACVWTVLARKAARAAGMVVAVFACAAGYYGILNVVICWTNEGFAIIRIPF
jgi:tryptophan-rich sensory protein